MATKEHHDNAAPIRKGGQSQHKRSGKELKNTMASSNSNNCMPDMEQQQSSNKGKGPSGENL